MYYLTHVALKRVKLKYEKYDSLNAKFLLFFFHFYSFVLSKLINNAVERRKFSQKSTADAANFRKYDFSPIHFNSLKQLSLRKFNSSVRIRIVTVELESKVNFRICLFDFIGIF